MNKSSNLYHVYWDNYQQLFGYESFIVAANNEEEARNTFPNGDNYDWDEKSYYCRYWIPKAHVDKLIVTYIGEYMEYVETPRIIMYKATDSTL